MEESQVVLKVIIPILAFFFLLLNGWLLFVINRLTTSGNELAKELNAIRVYMANNFVPLTRFERLEQKVDAMHQWRRENKD